MKRIIGGHFRLICANFIVCIIFIFGYAGKRSQILIQISNLEIMIVYHCYLAVVMWPLSCELQLRGMSWLQLFRSLSRHWWLTSLHVRDPDLWGWANTSVVYTRQRVVRRQWGVHERELFVVGGACGSLTHDSASAAIGDGDLKTAAWYR